MPENVPEGSEDFLQQKERKPRYRVERWSAFHAPNSAMLRYTLEGEGFDCFQWADRPGTVYGPHKHGEEQSHWIVSGQLEISVKGSGIFLLGPGDRDFMPAETIHSARVIGDEPVLYFIGIKRSAQPKSTVKPKRKAAKKRKSLESPSAKPTKAAAKPKEKAAANRKAAAGKPKPTESKKPRKAK